MTMCLYCGWRIRDGARSRQKEPRMPIEIDVHHSQCLVRMTARPPVTRLDVVRALEQQAALGAWRYATLGDYREAQWIPEAPDIHAFVTLTDKLERQYGTRGPVALVTGQNDAVFGMSRMYGLLADLRDAVIRGFRTEEDALAWLGSVSPATWLAHP